MITERCILISFLFLAHSMDISILAEEKKGAGTAREKTKKLERSNEIDLGEIYIARPQNKSVQKKSSARRYPVNHESILKKLRQNQIDRELLFLEKKVKSYRNKVKAKTKRNCV